MNEVIVMNELKRNRSRNVLAMLTVIAGFSAAFAAGYAFSQSTTPAQVRDSAQMRDAGSSAARVAPPVVETPATRDAAAMQNAFAEVAKAAEPAVVTITTRRRLPQANQGRRGPGPNPGPFGGPFGQPFEGPDPFEEFFRRFR